MANSDTPLACTRVSGYRQPAARTTARDRSARALERGHLRPPLPIRRLLKLPAPVIHAVSRSVRKQEFRRPPLTRQIAAPRSDGDVLRVLAFDRLLLQVRQQQHQEVAAIVPVVESLEHLDKGRASF